MRRLWMQIGRTSIARMYWLAASLVTMFITARALGPAGRGIAAAATSWVTLFAMVAGLSVASAVVFLASGRREQEWLPKTFGSLVAIIAVATACGWIVAAILGLAGGENAFRHLTAPLLMLAFATLPLLIWNESASALCAATDSIDRLNLAQMIGATATMAGAWLFVVGLGWGVYGAVLASALYQLIVAVSTLFFLKRRAGHVTADRAVVSTLLGAGLRLHLNTVASFTIVQMNVILINALRPADETGHYQVALQLITAMQMVPTAVNMSATSLVTRDGADAAWPRQKRLLTQAALLMTAVAIVGWFLAPLVVGIIGGPRFAESVPILRVLLVGLPLMTVSLVMSSQWFARGMFLHLSILSALFAVFSIIANLIVIPRHGALGSAWVTNAIYGAAFLANVVVALRIERSSRGGRVVTSAAPRPK